MRISHKHRFIFLALPRTGSTSVRNVLDNYSDIKSVHITERTRKFPFYHHISASELEKIFSNKGWKWSGYKKFCVIRNPYDRIVSLYHHHLKVRVDRPENKSITVKLLSKVKHKIRPTVTFKDYVMRIKPERGLVTSLKNFVCNKDGKFLVDDILMYENLSEDLSNYLSSLGINIGSEEIPHLNASKNRIGYRDYYDNDTKKRVSELYDYEISRFGYRF